MVATRWLQSHEEEIVRAWLEKVAATYPSHMAKFLLSERDQFRNPAGFTFRQHLPKLFRGIAEGADPATLKESIDAIVRLRAVQDFSPSEAVGFVFMLKEAVREACPSWNSEEGAGEFLGRVDGLALQAFDAYSACREKIFAIKADEAKRKLYILERIYGTAEAAENGGGSAPEPQVGIRKDGRCQ